MKNRFMLLALGALTALALAALPAVASAAPTVDPASGKFPLSFTSTGGASELRTEGANPVKCLSNHGTGKYTSGTTGEITLTFTGCSFEGITCTTSGQTSGTIKTGTSVFHNVYLNSAKTTPGVLITPPTGGTFATFVCGIGTITVTGNGVLGHLQSPGCGVKGKTGTLNFSATGAIQTYRQVEEAGTIYSLTTSIFGGSPKTSSMVAHGTVTTAEEYTLTCV